MLRHDEARGALLLERLGRSLHELALPIGRRHEILCSMASRMWCRAPDCGLPTGAMKGRWLVEFITATWEDLGRPSSQRTVDHALVCASRRIDAHDDDRAVLVHGDVHQWTPWKGDTASSSSTRTVCSPRPRPRPSTTTWGSSCARTPWSSCGVTRTSVPGGWGRGPARCDRHLGAGRRRTGLDWLTVHHDLPTAGRQMLAVADRSPPKRSGRHDVSALVSCA